MEGWSVHFHKLNEIWIFKKELTPLTTKRTTGKKVVEIVMKEEDEESEGLKNIEQIMKYYIWLQYDEKWNLNLQKCEKLSKYLI